MKKPLRKKPAKRTVTAWVWVRYHVSTQRWRVTQGPKADYTLDAKWFPVGPLTKIEVPLPSRGTR